MKFEDAQKKMIETLESSEFAAREDAQNTVPHLNTFKEFVRSGFITIGSQHGIREQGYNPDSKRYYEIRERAFVDGFMKQDRGNKFVEWINTYTDKVAWFVHVDTSLSLDDWHSTTIIPVTISASAPTKKKFTTFNTATKLLTVFTSDIMKSQKKQAHLNQSEKVVVVCCMDPVYCRKADSKDGLFGCIRDALKATR